MFDFAPDAWMADGLCLEYPRDWWFPERGENSELAKEVCRKCLVLRPCLTMAIAESIEHGIFGATSARGRQQLRKAGVPLDEILDAAESRLKRERRLDADARAAYVEEPEDAEPWLL